ncbi:MAG: hypothetical protein JZU52_16935 [Lamprocystis purpurea]|uniref:hypothetical protein n=1 Tax=Lamprocystis purpurea TaxID=61598 RepID=UPI00036FB50A|nr:hypothetical protein [Lamprocystis purpurea]MBV5275249.1 hypothetical protein [Lamprocystis purpurea]
MKYIIFIFKSLKSPWYYWYQGRKLVAISGMGLGMAVTGLFIGLTAGLSLFPLVLALAFDHLLIVVVVLYLILRFSLPAYLPIALADWFMVKQLVLIALPGILITRVCTLGVVVLARRDFDCAD